MKKKIINSLLIISIIFIGYLRHYIFFNAHYAAFYVQGNYPRSKTDSWLNFLDYYTLAQIDNFKWIFTIITLGVVFIITFLFIHFNFKKKKGTVLLFGILFIFSMLTYLLSYLNIPYTFQISRRALHFLQSPLPIMFLFIYYKFVFPSSKIEKV